MSRRLVREESGVAAVLFIALTAFVFVVFTFFMINLSKTHEHQRHLQLQVDDGALSTGSFFTGCFQTPSTANANIAREAHRFSGDPTYPTNYDASDPSYPTAYNLSLFPGPYNQQVLNTSQNVNSQPSAAQVQIGLNKATYGPYVGYTDFDPTYDLRPDLAGVQNLPCDSDILDVKATDMNIPARFGGFLPASSVTVKARARVEIKKVTTMSGFLPWAVPEVRPAAVIAIFVDEATGNVTGVQQLNDAGMTGTPGLPATLNNIGQEVWQADASFTGQSTGGTGVVIGVSGNALASPPSGSLQSICSLPKMTCYAGNQTTSGLWYIQGYSGAGGSISSPVLHSVTLQSLTCGDDSAPYFILNGDCDVQVQAHVDFGVSGDPTPAPNCAEVSVNGSPMAWQSGDLWTATVTIADSSGRNTLSISWDSGADKNGKCGKRTDSGNFGKAAAPYAADSASGPVEYVGVFQGGTKLGSLNKNSTANNVFVEVGLQPPLHVVANPTDPPILLRFGGGHGSRTQTLNCDHSPATLDDEVRNGCQTQYAVNNRGMVCSGGGGPTWTVANLPPPLPPPQPNPQPDCIQWQTGQITAMAKALHDRFESPCTPNNWVSYRTQVPPQLPPTTDPRWVALVVGDATDFVGNGTGVIPIRVFAGFYVTGWFAGGGAQGTTGCPGNDPHPLGYPIDSNKASGDVWGYFVTDVILGGVGNPTEYCDFSDVGLCVARLTQ